jgi:hypothetical protein
MIPYRILRETHKYIYLRLLFIQINSCEHCQSNEDYIRNALVILLFCHLDVTHYQLYRGVRRITTFLFFYFISEIRTGSHNFSLVLH